jgi:hypothetical protein
VLDHLLHHPGGDRAVDRVDRRGANANQYLAGSRRRWQDVRAERRARTLVGR